MGKNKQQAATEARTKKATPEVAEPAVAVEQPKPNGKADAKTIAAATPSKQQVTIDRLIAAFKEQRQIEVTPAMLVQDGKFINVMLGKEWPTIRVGGSGGVTVMELKSYTSAFDAAIKGDELLAKQVAREQKKAQPVVVAKSEPAAPAVPVKAKAA
jgi:hypothetical protein